MRRTAIANGSAAALVVAFAASAIAQDVQPLLPGDADAGAQIYGTECRGCHAVSIAPTLRGLVGRPIASVESFLGYSEGLKKKSGEAWTEASVDLFLASPQAFAPGTLMVKTIADAQQRADIIAYIASLPPPRQ
jgi:cytochrome c